MAALRSLIILFGSVAKGDEFFTKVQNKMHFAIHGQTAVEVIYNRADAKREHMGLTSCEDAPDGKIQRYDVSVAKNYLL